MHIWHSYLKIWSKTQKLWSEYDRFLELKFVQNGISKFDMPIYFYVKNRQKMLLMLFFFLDLASLDTICQKSLIRQKFQAPRAPQISNIYQSFEKNSVIDRILSIILIFRGARGGRNFWPINDFWPMMSYECPYGIICIYRAETK